MQLDLFTEERLPRRPYCTDDLEYGLVIRGVKGALEKRYIQANPHCLRYRMVFDLDHSDGAFGWMSRGVAPPNWASENLENGHAHIGYEIDVPVVTSEHGKLKPLRYAAAIEQAYRDRLEADTHYCGLITKNPYHPDWGLWVFHDQAYSLGELACHVDLNTKTPPAVARDATGLGRNCTLFDEVRHWAYRHVDQYRSHGLLEAWYRKWHDDVLERCLKVNVQFSRPLALPEVRATAKSIAKWTWTRFYGTDVSNAKFSRHQSNRGKRKGKAKRDELLPRAVEMHAAGKSYREIGEELGVAFRTVGNWIKSVQGVQKP